MMKTEAEILELFKASVQEIVGRPFDELTMDSSVAEFGIDSMTLAETISLIEDKLNIPIPDEDLMEVRRVRDLVGIVLSHLRRAQQ